MHMNESERVAGDGNPQALSFPEGWFRIGYSEELAVGQVVPLRYFGRALVLFRTESGIAQVLDAHCAHLGAHLRARPYMLLRVIRRKFWETPNVCLPLQRAD